jgi:hypothetical protein
LSGRGREHVDNDLLSRRWQMWLAPIAAIEYLEAALAFTSNHGLGVAVAQLDLTDRSAGCIYFPENYRRSASGASRRSAWRRVAASPDLNGRRDGIEVRFEHGLLSITIRSLGGSAPLSTPASFRKTTTFSPSCA